MEYKNTRVKPAARRFLHRSLQALHEVTYPFAEQKVYEYNQQNDTAVSSLRLLGVSVEHVAPSQPVDEVIAGHVDITKRGSTDV